MELRILGPAEAADAGAPVPVGPPRQRALLVRLALEGGRAVPAATLVDDLWGEEAPATAQKMVQVYVSNLRKVLPEGALATHGTAYALRLETDAERFERLRAEGADALAAGDPARAAARLRAALALWRGPALAEFDEPFAPGEAARLEESRLAALEDRIEADLALGRHGDLVGELEQLAQRHPLRERLRGQLVLALYRAGRQAEALAAYRAHREHLDRELGIAPSAALQELELRILRHDPALDLAAPGRPRAGRPDTLGRVRSADGTGIAYAVHGSGPPLVRAATWLTHLDDDWESPVWRHWLEGLAQRSTLIRYDERGCGLSDHRLGDLGLDRWVEDLAAVVDATGHEQVDLLGISQGGAVVLAYAHAHPGRVRRIVLYGAYARGRRLRGDDAQARESDGQIALIRAGWGSPSPTYRRVFTNLFLPDGTEEQMRWFDELQRRSTDGETAARLRMVRDRVDVTALAREVRAPTLVLHSRGDRMVPVGEGRLLAELIPGARFEELASRNHILLADERAWGAFLGLVDAFLRG